MTLPGFDAYPDPAPAKTAAGYLTWLHEQDYPDGWRFWALVCFEVRESQCEAAAKRLDAGMLDFTEGC